MKNNSKIITKISLALMIASNVTPGAFADQGVQISGPSVADQGVQISGPSVADQETQTCKYPEFVPAGLHQSEGSGLVDASCAAAGCTCFVGCLSGAPLCLTAKFALLACLLPCIPVADICNTLTECVSDARIQISDLTECTKDRLMKCGSRIQSVFCSKQNLPDANIDVERIIQITAEILKKFEEIKKSPEMSQEFQQLLDGQSDQGAGLNMGEAVNEGELVARLQLVGEVLNRLEGAEEEGSSGASSPIGGAGLGFVEHFNIGADSDQEGAPGQPSGIPSVNNTQ